MGDHTCHAHKLRIQHGLDQHQRQSQLDIMAGKEQWAPPHEDMQVRSLPNPPIALPAWPST